MKILMNNANGVKLLTGGKKCVEDIEVVPTFKAVEQVQITFGVGGSIAFPTICVHYTANGIPKTVHIVLDRDDAENSMHIPEEDIWVYAGEPIAIDKNTLFYAYVCGWGDTFDQYEAWFNDAPCFEKIVTGADGCPMLCLAKDNGTILVSSI